MTGRRYLKGDGENIQAGISVIIPVLDEAESINQTVEHVLSLPFEGGVEIIVVDGDREQKTIGVIKDQSVKKIAARSGRARQMNAGASRATGETLLFLHADTRLPSDALNNISSALNSSEVVGGAFDLGIESERAIFRVIERMASLRSRMTRIPYGDQAIFVRRDCFNLLGGYREIPLMEDVEFMRRLKKAGYKIHISSGKVRTSPRRWDREGVVYCTLRNWTLLSLYLLGISPERLVKFYR